MNQEQNTESEKEQNKYLVQKDKQQNYKTNLSEMFNQRMQQLQKHKGKNEDDHEAANEKNEDSGEALEVIQIDDSKKLKVVDFDGYTNRSANTG